MDCFSKGLSKGAHLTLACRVQVLYSCLTYMYVWGSRDILQSDLKPLSHQGGVLTATARRARKTQNAEVRAVRSPRAPRDRRGISTGRRGVS